jgi:adenosine deaminase
VWETLEHLRPERIGHGVRSIDDPRLVERLAEIAIPLEVCPSTNVATGGYATIQDHPFRRLRDSGVVVTLNSDDPGLFGSWVSGEYGVARDAFGFDDVELADIAGASVRASFADDDVKAQILRDIEAWLA